MAGWLAGSLVVCLIVLIKQFYLTTKNMKNIIRTVGGRWSLWYCGVAQFFIGFSFSSILNCGILTEQ